MFMIYNRYVLYVDRHTQILACNMSQLSAKGLLNLSRCSLLAGRRRMLLTLTPVLALALAVLAFALSPGARHNFPAYAGILAAVHPRPLHHHRGTSLIRKRYPWDPTVGLFLGSYGGPMGVGVCL